MMARVSATPSSAGRKVMSSAGRASGRDKCRGHPPRRETCKRDPSARSTCALAEKSCGRKRENPLKPPARHPANKVADREVAERRRYRLAREKPSIAQRTTRARSTYRAGTLAGRA